jgi:hypothetical protein
MRIALTVAAIALATLPAHADEVTDALQNAITAYEDGDIAYAMEELTYAQSLLQAQQAQGLAGFLPEAPEGWTREINSEAGAALGMMGGGTAAEASYSGGGESFTITFTADNPMVAAMAGMFGNAAMLTASGAKMIRVGREKFVDQDGELTAVIDNRILIQASGADPETMVPVLETIDFRELSRFGS